MSDEKIKLKNKINNNSLANKEINITTESDQNRVEIVSNSIKIENSIFNSIYKYINIRNINNNKNNIIFTYGNYRIFLYDSKGDPLFLIGPDYSYFISMLIMNLIYFLFFNYLLIILTKYYIAIIGILLNIIQFLFFIICCIKNPGLPKKELQNEFLLTKDPDRYQRCNLCHFIVDNTKRYIHCHTCGCCCEGYDHHCPWTSKCVGKGNIFYFDGMIGMISIALVYMIFAFVLAKPKK
jgi:hypothetical protein